MATHLKSIGLSILSVALLGGILWVGGSSIEAQQSNVDLIIEPDQHDLSILEPDATVQFRALYLGEDVTEEAGWSYGTPFFSGDFETLEIVSPGEYKLGTKWKGGAIPVHASYEAPDGETHFASASTFHTGFIRGSRVNLFGPGENGTGSAEGRPFAQFIDIGEEIDFRAVVDPGEVCASFQECGCREGSISINCPLQGTNWETESWRSLTPDVLEHVEGGTFRGVGEGTGTIEATGTVEFIDGFRGDTQIIEVTQTREVTVADEDAPLDTSFGVSLVSRNPAQTADTVNYEANVFFHSSSYVFDALDAIGDTSNNNEYFMMSSYGIMRSGWGSGGMLIFDMDGNVIDERDVVWDAIGGTPHTCKHNTGCHAGSEVIPVAKGQFVRELDAGQGPTRSPFLYEIEEGGAGIVSNLFINNYTQALGSRGTNRDVQEGDYQDIENVAVANGVMLAREQRIESVQVQDDPNFGRVVIPTYGSYRLGFYSLPSFNFIADAPLRFVPIVGLGEYIIAYPANSNRTGADLFTDELEVYRIPSRTALANGAQPELVEEITKPPGTFRVLFALDSQEPQSRVALFFISQTGADKIEIYEPGSSGISLVEERAGLNLLVDARGVAPGALAGDYLAYLTQEREFVVENDGEALSVEPLVGDYEHCPMAAIAPRSGRVMVVGKPTFGGQGGNVSQCNFLYVYQINDFDGQAPRFEDPIGDGGGGLFGDFPGLGDDGRLPNVTGDETQREADERTRQFQNQLRSIFQRIEAFFGPLGGDIFR